MSSIRVDAGAMQRRADQLYGEARNVGAVITGLKELSARLHTEWEGEESDSFSEWYYSEFRPNLIDGQAAIGRFAEAIFECAQEIADDSDIQGHPVSGDRAD